MTNRKLPFGYRMESGQVRAAEAEAEVVEMVFACYAKGASYRTPFSCLLAICSS